MIKSPPHSMGAGAKRSISTATIFALTTMGILGFPNVAQASTATSSVVEFVDNDIEEGVLPSVTTTITAASGTVDPTGTVSWSYCFGALEFPVVTDIAECTDLPAASGVLASLVDVGTVGDGISTSSLTGFTPPTSTGFYIFVAEYSGDATYSLSRNSASLLISAAPSAYELDFDCSDSTFISTFTGGPTGFYTWEGSKNQDLELNSTQVVRVNFSNCEQGYVIGGGDRYYFNEGGGGFGGVEWLSNPKTVSIILNSNENVDIYGKVAWNLTPFVSLLLNLSNIAAGGGGGEGGGGGAPEAQTLSLSQVNYFVSQGFVKGKSTLKNGMKAFINEQLDSTTGYKKFVCTGTVRGKKWTETRTALANARAAVACDYIEDRFPRAVFELKKRLIKKQSQDAQTVRIRVFS